MVTPRSSLTIIMLCLLGAACGPSEAELAIAIEETMAARGVFATDEAGTQQVLQLRENQTSTSIAQTEVSIAQTATHESAATSTRSAEMTQIMEATRAMATSQAASMYDAVQEIALQGYIDNTAGTFHQIPDFHQTWAQIYWYQWWPTEFSPDDFVIRAEASMDEDATYPDWASACGIVFREQGSENHYLFYVNMYGWATIDRRYKDQKVTIGWDRYGPLNVRNEDLQFTLAVDGPKMTVFVNGEYVFTDQDTVLTSGNLALSLLSGTNRGFGTRCDMTNIELWILE